MASVLVGGAVRGLPDHVARAVRVQRAYEGHPLDDVIVDADGAGGPAALSLQVKRSLTFGDNPLFHEVMKQCWDTFSAAGFRQERDRFGPAIGTATGADDDRRTVLEWARQSADAADFHGRIRAPGVANDRMRTFVSTVRASLDKAAGSTIDDDACWRFLKHFVLVHVDFEHESSSRDHQNAVDRLRPALEPWEAGRVADLWQALVAKADAMMAAAGSADRAALMEELGGRFTLVGGRGAPTAGGPLSPGATATWTGASGGGETVDASGAGAGASALLDAQMTAQLLALTVLQKRVVGQAAAQIEQAIDRIRRGDGSAVEGELHDLRADPAVWTALPPADKAKLFRLLASLRLRADDMATAERLADEADGLAPPSDEPRLRALIALHRHGAEAALAILGPPAGRDGAHLAAGLLIEAGDLDAAADLLATHARLTPPDAETWRLRALLALERNDRDGAVAAIREAEALAPDWPAVQEAAGRVRYARAVSPAVPPTALRGPNPLDPDLVHEDETARVLLDEAERAFARRLERALDERDRAETETWRLAVLAARRHRRKEAEAYARTLLRDDPSHWGAIAWSLAEDFVMDHTGALRALTNRLEGGRGEIAHLVVAFWLHLAEGRTDEASRLLEEHARRFQRPGERALLDVWQRRLSADATAAAESEPMPVRLGSALEQARETGDWEPIAPLLAALDDEEHAPLLMSACRALAAAGRWMDITPHIDALEHRIGTAAALRLAAFAANNTGAPSKALALIETYRRASASPSLPADLRRLRIVALQATGDVASGLHEAAELAAVSGDPADRILQAEIAVRIGDLTVPELVMRDPAVLPVLAAEQAVQWAGRLAPVAPDTSRKLLDHAVARGLPDDAIPFALNQGLRLAADDVVRRLMPELARLAVTGGDSLVRAVSIDEIPDLLADARRQAEDLSGRYARGEMPVHILAPRMGAGFAALFGRGGTDTAPVGRDRPPLFFRYGGREATATGVSLADPLHVDTTALLLADGIGLLDVLEEAGIALHLPPSLPQAILHLEVHADDHQPDHTAAQEAIRRAVADGRARAIDSDAAPVGNDPRAWRVVHGADIAGETTIEPSGVGLLPVRGVADALLAGGRLDPDRHARVIERLGAGAGAAPAMLPRLGDRLDCEYNTLESLTVAGGLEEALAGFDLGVDRQYLDYAASGIAALEERRALAARLRRLRQRIVDRLGSGTWHTSPARGPAADEDDAGPGETTAIEACLRDLLRIPADETATLWIDDRFVSRHLQAEGHAIVGVADVLDALRAAGRIDGPRYFEFLLRLRRARAHFLPATAEEVLHHLAAAPSGGSGIVETPALRALRQSFADALLLEEHWSVPDADPLSERHGELLLALRASRLFDETLIAIWERPDLDAARREAWSDWAWSALRAHRFARVPRAGDEAAARVVAVQHLAAPFALTIRLFALRDAAKQRRYRELVAWLERRVLAPALEADPGLADEVAAALARLLAGTLASDAGLEGADGRRLWRAFLGRFIDVLPEAIRERLHEDVRFTAAVGLRIHHLISLEGLTFERDDFWSAVARARSGRTAALRSADGKAEVRIAPPRRTGAGGYAVTGAIRIRLADDPAFALLATSAAVRRHALEGHPDWFDGPAAERASLIAAIAEEPAPAMRMRLVMERRDRSVPYRRAQQQQALQARRPMDLAPSEAGDLLLHLRLGPLDEPPAETLARAARRLVDEVGPAEAVWRLCGLPVPPPDPIVECFAALEPQERDRVLGDLAGEVAGPVGRLQVVALMRRFGHSRLGNEVDRLLADWRNASDAFAAVLRWMAAQHGDAPEWRGVPGPYRLVLIWTHAHQIADALLAAGIPRDDIVAFFSRPARVRRLERTLTTEAGYDDSLLEPTLLLDGAALLFHGLASALGSEGDAVLTPERRARLATLLLIDVEQGIPWPTLLRDIRGLNDPFGSFLGARPEGWLDGVDVGWARIDEARAAARAAIVARPEDADGWTSAVLTGLDREPACSDLADALACLDLVTLAMTDADDHAGFVLRTAAGLAARSGPEAIRCFEDALIAAAAALAERHHGPVLPQAEARDGTPAGAAQRLIEALGALSAHPSPRQAVEHLANGLLRLARAWPNAIPFGATSPNASSICSHSRSAVLSGTHTSTFARVHDRSCLGACRGASWRPPSAEARRLTRRAPRPEDERSSSQNIATEWELPCHRSIASWSAADIMPRMTRSFGNSLAGSLGSTS
ncbi:hypothetical protein [Azospirillum brasilense]|uniref:hypothetical protein n=1 Tax=Azospirillum brasilense TaxID=192 RepID=UPI0010C02FE4|nr:hypothetical protein [Azospirillum brasilense]